MRLMVLKIFDVSNSNKKNIYLNIKHHVNKRPVIFYYNKVIRNSKLIFFYFKKNTILEITSCMIYKKEIY